MMKSSLRAATKEDTEIRVPSGQLKSLLRAATKEATELRVPSGQVEVITPKALWSPS